MKMINDMELNMVNGGSDAEKVVEAVVESSLVDSIVDTVADGVSTAYNVLKYVLFG